MPTITRVTHGFIVDYSAEEDENGVGYSTVFSENDRNELPESALYDVLWELINYYGGRGSRHDEHRLTVTYEPGDKWLDNQEEVASDD